MTSGCPQSSREAVSEQGCLQDRPGREQRVLVTGSSGFIGSSLCVRLLEQGYKVRACYLESDMRGVPSGVTERVHCGDLVRFSNWGALLRDVDYVVHLAALAHQVGRAKGQGKRYFEVNTEVSRRLARALSRSSVRRLVFVSTVAAVCSESEVPVTEEMECSPTDDYGKSKLEAERAISAELQSSATDWCILRPTLVYGPGNPGNMGRLLRLLRTRLPLPLASLRNRRNFLFLGNLLDVIGICLTLEQASREVFLVSDDEMLFRIAETLDFEKQLPAAVTDRLARDDVVVENLANVRSASCSFFYLSSLASLIKLCEHLL